MPLPGHRRRGGVVRAVDAGAQLRQEPQIAVPRMRLEVRVGRVLTPAAPLAAMHPEKAPEREVAAPVAVLARDRGFPRGNHRAARRHEGLDPGDLRVAQPPMLGSTMTPSRSAAPAMPSACNGT